MVGESICVELGLFPATIYKRHHVCDSNNGEMEVVHCMIVHFGAEFSECSECAE